MLSIFTEKTVTTLRNLLERKKFQRLALKKLNTGHYKLSVIVNQKKGDFILDTGASTSCIGMSSAKFFDLQPQESDIKAAGAGAINMETSVSMNTPLQIATIKLKNQDFVLFDLSHVNTALAQVEEEPVQGILGADILKQLRAVIDYGRNCLYIRI